MAWRLAICFLTVAPPAYLMGFPMPTAMTTLARLGKEHMFLWAWGINGCFSVIGAAAVPLIATAFGLSSVLAVGGVAYLLAIPAFFAVLLPMRPRGGRIGADATVGVKPSLTMSAAGFRRMRAIGLCSCDRQGIRRCRA